MSTNLFNVVGKIIVGFLSMCALCRINDASRTANQNETLNFCGVLKCSMKTDASTHAVAQVDRLTACFDQCIGGTRHICCNVLRLAM